MPLILAACVAGCDSPDAGSSPDAAVDCAAIASGGPTGGSLSCQFDSDCVVYGPVCSFRGPNYCSQVMNTGAASVNDALFANGCLDSSDVHSCALCKSDPCRPLGAVCLDGGCVASGYGQRCSLYRPDAGDTTDAPDSPDAGVDGG